MAEDIKVSAVEAEEPKSMAEKEETVLENAGISTKEDGMYKLDLNKINEQNQQENRCIADQGYSARKPCAPWVKGKNGEKQHEANYDKNT